MQLAHARIRNFRSLRDVSVDFGAHTAFIGGNGAGKSSILRALEKFYAPAKVLDVDDYFGRDQAQPVEIELTFNTLSAEEAEDFESRVREGRLTVTRVFDTGASSGRYHGVVPSNPGFLAVRAITQAVARRAAYNALRAEPTYADLPNATNALQVDDGMRQWEEAHPELLTLNRDDGQFFGFQNAGRGALQRYTSFVFVPAVREAGSDAADAKASAIGRLLELVVRSAILQRNDIMNFREELNAKYKQLTAAENMPELGALAGRLTTDLRELYADAEVGLTWRESAEMQVPLPNADVTLSDDGFGGPVDRQGHGLQRAFIFTLLQQLARASVMIDEPSGVAEGGDAPEPKAPAQAPSLILAIEEPELYQHPTKQRHLSSVLRRLSAGTLPGADGRTQVVFASHSPMFVSIPHVEEIRFVRRVTCDEFDFKECELNALALAVVATQLETALQKPKDSFTASTLAPRLHILGPELAEGFFADAVVLVEGPSDKAALAAAAHQLGVSFEASGIAVLAVDGKSKMDKPLLIFRELGIPTYPVWDCDGAKGAALSLALVRAADPEPNHQTGPTVTIIAERYAHFGDTLEAVLETELTKETYDAALVAACAEFDVAAGRDAQKSPELMRRMLSIAAENGKSCETLRDIVRAVWRELKGVEIA